VGKDSNMSLDITSACPSPSPLSRSSLGAAIAVIVMAALSLFVASAAMAQEVEEPYVSVADGELALEASALAPAAEVTVSGSGFAPEGPLRFVLANVDAGTTIMAEEIFADSTGDVSYSFSLPTEMVTADYLARISGFTTDGGSLRLETTINIVGNVEQLTTTTVAPTTTAAPAPTSPTSVPVGEPTPVPVEGAASATAPPPTLDTLSDSGEAANLNSEVAAADPSDSSSGNAATVLIVVAAIVAALGAAGFFVRRRATKPY